MEELNRHLHLEAITRQELIFFISYDSLFLLTSLSFLSYSYFHPMIHHGLNFHYYPRLHFLHYFGHQHLSLNHQETFEDQSQFLLKLSSSTIHYIITILILIYLNQ